MERDPVCGEKLLPGQEGANANYQDRTYHFCSTECRNLFLKNPSQYLGPPKQAGQGQQAKS